MPYLEPSENDQIDTQLAKHFVMFDMCAKEKGMELSQLSATPTWFVAIRHIIKSEQPSVNSVAKFLNITPASSSAMVKKMVARGFLTSEQDSLDKRRFILQTTPKAMAFMQEAMSMFKTGLQQQFSILDDTEKETLLALFKKLNQK